MKNEQRSFTNNQRRAADEGRAASRDETEAQTERTRTVSGDGKELSGEYTLRAAGRSTEPLSAPDSESPSQEPVETPSGRLKPGISATGTETLSRREPRIASTSPISGNLPSKTEIMEREGNYIFAYGFPGAGKSTFQSHLVRWVMEGGDYITGVARIDSVDSSTRLINKWREEWQKNRFPDSTPQGEDNIVEIRVEAKPKRGVRTPLIFNFLEVSGEDLKTIVPGEAPGAIVGPLREYLANPKIRFLLVMVVDPEVPGEQNDTLFLNLLDYLAANFGSAIVARLAILLLLPKPDIALAKLRADADVRAEYHGLDHTHNLGIDLVRLYFERFLPATFARVSDWDGDWEVARMKVGDVVDQDPGEDPHFVNADYADIEAVFNWTYKTFTGREPGATLLQKIWKYLCE